jgi:hypothetical protein
VGGSVVSWEAGTYSLGSTQCDRVPDEPWPYHHNARLSGANVSADPYVENIGVSPDVFIDYMTSANLYQSGKPFVDAFVPIIVNEIVRSWSEKRP